MTGVLESRESFAILEEVVLAILFFPVGVTAFALGDFLELDSSGDPVFGDFFVAIIFIPSKANSRPFGSPVEGFFASNSFHKPIPHDSLAP